MDDKELDAIERNVADYGPLFMGYEVPGLVAALREAWAEVERLAADLYVQQRATDEAEAEVERMRRGEVDGIFTSVVHECCSRAQAAEVALDRVRALLYRRSPMIGAGELRAAIDGTEE